MSQATKLVAIVIIYRIDPRLHSFSLSYVWLLLLHALSISSVSVSKSTVSIKYQVNEKCFCPIYFPSSPCVMACLPALALSSSIRSETDSANSGWKLSSSLKQKIAAFLDLEHPSSTSTSKCAWCICDKEHQARTAEQKMKVAAASEPQPPLPPHVLWPWTWPRPTGKPNLQGHL